jgi:Lon protease-like protein
MSSAEPQLGVSRSPASLDDLPVDSSQYEISLRSEVLQQPRDIVRLFQCQRCSRPLVEPVTLPCGKSICRRCIPEPHARVNITYPALPNRLRGLHCPFSDCDKEHAIGDCSIDVVFNKVSHMMLEHMKQSKTQAATKQWMTHVMVQDPWATAGITSMRINETSARPRVGGRLIATWTLAEEGELTYDDDVTYGHSSTSSQDELEDFEQEVLQKAREAARTEMDCQVCYALFFDPLTTGCGHTFCRSCLHRTLDHSAYCPICRRKLALNPLLNRLSCPSNDSLSRITQKFWLDELSGRKSALEKEEAERYREFDTPLFVCTLSFPMMPTFLHVFEPRYRLMIRRAAEGNKTFGMILPKPHSGAGEPEFYELGTLLRVVNIQPFPDGRSLVETRGLSRFRVVKHSSVDGYLVARTERIDDVSLEEEEAVEASEVVSEPATADATQATAGPKPEDGAEPAFRAPETVDSLDSMSTERLMQVATGFVAKMRAQSVPWLTERMLEMYPQDPAVFPWWFASMLPVKDLEKYRLLATTSVRERLKICCAWIIEWERTRWSLHDCVIL